MLSKDQIDALQLGTHPLRTLNEVRNAPEGFTAFVNCLGPSSDVNTPTQQWYFSAEPLKALSRVESSAAFRTAQEALTALKRFLYADSLKDPIPDLLKEAFIVFGEVRNGPKLEVWKAEASPALMVALNKGLKMLVISPTAEGEGKTFTLHYTSPDETRRHSLPLPIAGMAEALNNWVTKL